MVEFRRGLTLLLALLPLWFGNWAMDFLEQRQHAWKEQGLEENARQELEGLRAMVDFSRRLEWCAGQIGSRVVEGAEKGDPMPVLGATLAAQQTRTLGRSITGAQGCVVLFGPSESDDQIIGWGSRDQAIPRRVVQKILRHCTHWKASGASAGEAQTDRLLAGVFGPGVRSEILALSQRGLSTQVLFQRRQHWLIWDRVEITGGRMAAFLLLVPNDDRSRYSGYDLSLHRVRNPRSRYGFLQMFPGPVGDRFSPALSRTPAFQNWLARWRQNTSLPEIEFRGWPWGVQVGSCRLFAMPVVPFGTHLAVCLKPYARGNAGLGRFRFLFNWVVFLGVLCVWRWEPMWRRSWRLPLGWRFLGLFLFATLLPLFQLLVAVSAYLQERGLATRSQIQQKLTRTLQVFDGAKDRLQTEYCGAFLQALHDPELRDQLKNARSVDADLLALARRHFQSASGSLPLLALAIFDANASGPVALGDALPEGFARQVRFYRYTLAQTHRESLGSGASVLPPLQIPEDVQGAMDCYEGSSGNRFTSEMEFQRSVPMSQSFGRGRSLMMHDRLAIDGQDRFTLLVLWRDADSDRKIMEQTLREIREGDPDLWIGAYRVRGNHLTPILPEDGHRPDGWVSLARKCSLGAFHRHGSLVLDHSDPMVVALPARRFEQTILVAMQDTRSIQDERTRTLAWVLPGLAFSFLLLLLFGRWTAGRVVFPVLGLKGELEAIAVGRFPDHIDPGRRDEIGAVMKASEDMTSGLRERERLARLVSDQAMAVLDRQGDAGGLGKGRAARGVVLFSDIRGFTTICEREDPKVVTALLNRHFSEVSAIIARQGGRVDKFIGDAVQAFFEGDPGKEPAGIRAFRAGVLILRLVERLSAERTGSGQFAYRVGVGLAGGLVNLGFIGDPAAVEGRVDFALLGPPVKRAMEMESLTKKYPELPLAVAPEIASWMGSLRKYLVPLPGAEAQALTTVEDGVQEVMREAGLPSPPEETTAFAVREGQESHSRLPAGPGTWMKGFWVGLGWMVLLVPLLGVLLNRWSLANERTRREQREAVERNSALISRLQGQTSLSFLLEDRLETMIREATTRFAGHPSSEELKAAGLALQQRLDSLGIRVRRVAVYRLPEGTIASSSAPVSLVYSRGYSESEQESLLHLLPYAFLNSNPENDAHYEQIKGVRTFLGFPATPSQFDNSFQGRVKPVLGTEGPSWFFWQKLFPADRHSCPSLARTIEPLREVPVERVQPVGALLLLLERGQEEDAFLRLLVETSSDSETRLAASSNRGEPAAFAPGFPETLRKQVESGNPLSGTEGWEVLEGRINQPFPTRIVAATRIPEASWSLSETLRLTAFLIVLGFLGYAWQATVRREEFLGRSLAAQVWWGCLAGVILPLTLANSLGTRFVAGEADNERDRRRQGLRRELETYDQRLIWHQGMIVAGFADWTRDPGFQQEFLARDTQRLQERFNRLASHSGRVWPEFYLTEVLAIYPDKESLTISDLDSPNMDAAFSRILGVQYREIIQIINPGAGVSPATSNVAKAAQDEMIAQAALDILRSVFGTGVYFELMYGLGSPMSFAAGFGKIIIHHFLIPDPVKPKGVAAWFYDANNGVNHAASRIQNSVRDQALYSTCLIGYYGFLCDPFRHLRVPELSQALRWTVAAKRPQSLTFRKGEHALLVESTLGYYSPDSCLWAITAEAGIQERVRTLLVKLDLVLLAMLLLAVFLAYSASADLLAPISLLERAMREVQAGFVSRRLTSDRNDEMGDLMTAFNLMARGLEERHLIRRMVSHGARIVTESGAAPESERREVSVLMLGSNTSGLGQRTSSGLFSSLNTQLSVISRLASQEQGDIDKVIGEKILVIFHHVAGRQDAAQRAIRMLEGLARATLEGRLPLPWSAGLHSGVVISGCLGAGNRQDFTVIGDAVNAAARLESLAEQNLGGAVFVSDEVAMHVKGSSLVPQGDVQVKGRNKAIRVFRWLSPPPVPAL